MPTKSLALMIRPYIIDKISERYGFLKNGGYEPGSGKSLN